MKKIKKLNSSRVALFAGAAALMALTPNTHAQSSVDSLLNKLEQKGVLTVDEAKALKAENVHGSIDDFNKAIELKPDSTDAYNNRAITYFNQGNKKPGCRDAQKVCELGNCVTLEVAKGKGYCH